MKFRHVQNIMLCLICLLLSSTFLLISRVPDEWPTWTKEMEFVCSMDVQCHTLSTCIEGNCLPFWPARPVEKKTRCHDTCSHDIQLYENHLNLQTVGHFVHFKFRERQCVVAYQQLGNSVALSEADFESRRDRAVLRRERVSENWTVALCAAVDPPDSVSSPPSPVTHPPKKRRVSPEATDKTLKTRPLVHHLGVLPSKTLAASSTKLRGLPWATVAAVAPVATLPSTAPHWVSYANMDLLPDESMGYSNTLSSTAEIQEDCIILGASAFTVTSNNWVWFHRNVGIMVPKPGAILWVNKAAQIKARYGCSRHEHACVEHPLIGAAPCCIKVMQLIMEEMTLTLKRHGIHWRIASGQLTSLARDGILSPFDHDFDPIFEQNRQQQAIAIIKEEMHLSGKPSKWRDGDYYYTQQLARKQKTNWSKYTVLPGDFNWASTAFQSPFALQQSPTFMDIGQATGAPPEEHTTVRCNANINVLCPRGWESEVSAVDGGGPLQRPKWILDDQWAYSGYDNIIKPELSLLWKLSKRLKDNRDHQEDVQDRLSRFPHYWSQRGNYFSESETPLSSSKPSLYVLTTGDPPSKNEPNIDEHALTPKYVVVMPSVKRNNDIYLKKTLVSLEIAKPSEITVILVNGHQPPEHHSYLNDWCASHESYKCIVPPPVPDSLLQSVIHKDERNDTDSFLRWRTHETVHALFGLKAALKMKTDYIIWIQDDVIVDPLLFSKLKEGDLFCLNDGRDYCGAVGYLFSNKFVQTLILKIEAKKLTMPIDWIIYDPFSLEATVKPLETIPLVHHIGVSSSKPLTTSSTKAGKYLSESNTPLVAEASATVFERTTKIVLSKRGKSKPKIAVAIPTYNRAGYVQLCATALSNTLDPNDVWLFDDHSTTYSVEDLKKWFHTENVQQKTLRQKADKQARHILEWFVGTDYDWLITLDSDLIVRPNWLELLRGMLPRTQGVMSLYHSGNPNHPTLNCDTSLCEMKSLGNAGVAWSKVLAKKMLLSMTQSDGFDWGWTEWLQKQKIPQYAAKDSLVLHVGMHGTWGADSKREKSVGFPMDKLSPDVRGRAELFLKGTMPVF